LNRDHGPRTTDHGLKSSSSSSSSSSSIFSSIWTRALILALLLIFLGGGQAPGFVPPPNGQARSAVVDVFIDSGAVPLAAWQVELAAERGKVKIIAIEGGEHPAYKEPPRHDPAAIGYKRIVLAAFNTGKDLPKGKTRVARLRLQTLGDTEPDYATRLDAAAAPDGKRIRATVSLVKG